MVDVAVDVVGVGGLQLVPVRELSPSDFGVEDGRAHGLLSRLCLRYLMLS